MKSKPFKTFDTYFSYFECYDNYIISTVKEDIVFDYEHLNWVIYIIEEHYKGKKIGYIANRQYRYTTNPLTLRITAQHKTLSAMAVVQYTKVDERASLYEKHFYSKPFGIFNSIEDSVIWIEAILEVKNKVGL